jgi:uncharacterized protein (TIGR02757 family)
LDSEALKAFLDRKVDEYNRPAFIAEDPVCIPHTFSKKQDIEIAGFFAATFAWGNRTTIIQKCRLLMELMDNSPHEFILDHKEKDLIRFEGFCHRTFNTTDLLYFISFLQYHFKRSETLEDAFVTPLKKNSAIASGDEPVELALNYFSSYFFSLEHVPERTRKHVAAPMKNSGCKRLNMYLRWMVRNDKKGVDFGIWKTLKPAQLICPLDLHVARVAKKFNLLNRPNPDWQSALELTKNLRVFDKKDPVKYDFALFALGVMEKF